MVKEVKKNCKCKKRAFWGKRVDNVGTRRLGNTMRVTYLAMIRPCKVETRVGKRGWKEPRRLSPILI